MTLSGETGHRKRQGLKRILFQFSLAILLFAILSMLLTGVISSKIFARPNQNLELVLEYSPSMALSYPRRQVQFPSGRNTLTGYLYSAQNPQGLVLIAHGMRGSGSSHLAEAVYFIDQGFSVFTFDGTGAGNSTGSSVIGLQQMIPDLMAAVDFLTGEPVVSELPLLLYGHSMGAYACVITAQECSQVKAVVSISGFESPMQVMLDSGKRYVGSAAAIGYPFLYLQNYLTFGDLANRSASSAINNTSADFLIVHGTRDTVISTEDSILGQRDVIKNPDVTYLLVDEEYRSTHSGAWLTQEAAEYALQIGSELEALQLQYDSEVPDDVFRQFCSQTDYQTRFSLDHDFMGTVVDFYRSAIAE